jgi:hypothetical protein
MRWQRWGTAGLLLVLAGASLGVADKPRLPRAKKDKEKDKEVVSSKPKKRPRATTINFKKELNLPFPSLGTLGSRIESARRAPDPVSLAHSASELAVAEKVSGKKASLTSSALMKEAAELARLRKEVAELQAVAQVQQQVTREEGSVAFWKTEIANAKKLADEERAAVRRNELPKDTPRKILINNYTSQYIDLWVNGNYKMQVPPGGSKWCVVEHKWNPTILTAYGSDDNAVWGPRNVFGAYKTYTWNIQGY